jgi:carbon starvation protein
MAAWSERYDASKGWNKFGLSQKVSAFVEGGGNFLTAIGIPLKFAIGIVAVLVASFAATTLDTATRLQRYVTQELGAALGIKPLTNKYVATGFVIACGFAVALTPGPVGPGSGGLLLWPLFGATNQLLAGLAFMVIVFYLWRRNKPVWFAVGPLVLMVVLPAWAMLWNMFNPASGWCLPLVAMIGGQEAWAWNNNHLLLAFGVAILGLQAWTVIEAVSLWSKAKGVLEEALPPLVQPTLASGRSC